MTFILLNTCTYFLKKIYNCTIQKRLHTRVLFMIWTFLCTSLPLPPLYPHSQEHLCSLVKTIIQLIHSCLRFQLISERDHACSGTLSEKNLKNLLIVISLSVKVQGKFDRQRYFIKSCLLFLMLWTTLRNVKLSSYWERKNGKNVIRDYKHVGCRRLIRVSYLYFQRLVILE